MNIKILAAGLALAYCGTALAGTIGGASINIDVLAVNGMAKTSGTVNTVQVSPGDVILFGINGSLPASESDSITGGTIRIADLGPLGNVNPDSLDDNVPASLGGSLLPITEDLIFGNNGFNFQFFAFSPPVPFGTSGRLGTFELTVTATEGVFTYSEFQDRPAPNNPQNRLRTNQVDYDLLSDAQLSSDTIVIPAPGAGAIAMIAGLGLAGRRRR